MSETGQDKIIEESGGDTGKEGQKSSSIKMMDMAGDLDTAVARAEKYFSVQEKMRKLAIKMTSPVDWIDENGNPYLQWTGASKIAFGFGVSYKDLSFEKEIRNDEKGEYVVFHANGIISFHGREMPETGSGSSRDSFFGVRTRKGKDGKNERYFLPTSEVDLNNIRKKALTNFLNRGIKSMLGLSFTWEEVAEITEGKINKEIIVKSGRSVSYSKGSKGGSQPLSEEEKGKLKKIGKMILDISMGDQIKAKQLLIDLTKFGDYKGQDTLSKLSGKQIGILLPKVESEFKKFEDQINKESK